MSYSLNALQFFKGLLFPSYTKKICEQPKDVFLEENM